MNEARIQVAFVRNLLNSLRGRPEDSSRTTLASCGPMPTLALMRSMRRAANPAQSSKQRAGRTPGASCSSWRDYARCRLRSRPCGASTSRSRFEREINGEKSDKRIHVRRARSKPLVEELEHWPRLERRKLSSKNPLAKAIDYSLKRWNTFTRFLDDGRTCMTNNAAECAVRGIAVGRRDWTFCGSDAGVTAQPSCRLP